MRIHRIAMFLMTVPFAAGTSVWAGSWSTQSTLATNAYQGSVAIDANGNLVAVWYQNGVNEIWASISSEGHSWAAPVDISGGTGSSTGNPTVRMSASGNATAIYTSPTIGAAYVDKPAGGHGSRRSQPTA